MPTSPALSSFIPLWLLVSPHAVLCISLFSCLECSLHFICQLLTTLCFCIWCLTWNLLFIFFLLNFVNKLMLTLTLSCHLSPCCLTDLGQFLLPHALRILLLLLLFKNSYFSYNYTFQMELRSVLT